ncbi:hypothetical protein WMF31_13325 [Sorangium sp. So ce1036]|uniref:hypothetical protein n=1 Tax=Sorangium sp. So ce1036 TaxID=3133328 RepID=UPI003F0D5559
MASERKAHRGLTLVGLILSLAMAALESTAVATAMPTVIGDLGGIREYAWATTACLLPSSVLVPICGDPSVVQHLGEALTSGLTTVLWIIAAMGVVGFISARWFPHVPLQAGEDKAVAPPSSSSRGPSL